MKSFFLVVVSSFAAVLSGNAFGSSGMKSCTYKLRLDSESVKSFKKSYRSGRNGGKTKLVACRRAKKACNQFREDHDVVFKCFPKGKMFAEQRLELSQANCMEWSLSETMTMMCQENEYFARMPFKRSHFDNYVSGLCRNNEACLEICSGVFNDYHSNPENPC